MDAKKLLSSKVITEDDCMACEFGPCCAFLPLFQSFLTLQEVIFDEKGCPRDWDLKKETQPSPCLSASLPQ